MESTIVGKKFASKSPQDNAQEKLLAAFVGPHAENSQTLSHLVETLLCRWASDKGDLFPDDPRVDRAKESAAHKTAVTHMSNVIDDLGRRLAAELPLASGRYVAHMLSERSIPGILGQIMGTLYNANNVAPEASRVSLEIEREAMSALANLVGFSQPAARGHFTSCGTIANFEAMVRARYRLLKWLSVAAADRVSGSSSLDLMGGAHLGWERFDEMAARHKMEYVDGFNMLYRNPFEITATYSKIFGQTYRGPVVLLPGSAHYSWEKGATLLGLGKEALWHVDTDSSGRMDHSSLEKRIKQAIRANRPILMVVSVGGTTELGVLDQVDEIQDVLDRYKEQSGLDIWHHVDAAWGGFFKTLTVPAPGLTLDIPWDLSIADTTVRALSGFSRANSITIDPHKLGYVPYSAGAFLSRYGREYYLDPAQAPYIQWESNDRRPPQTLEGSRASGGAMSVWLTDKIIGLHSQGLGALIDHSLVAKRAFGRALSKMSPMIRVISNPDSNIICFCVAKEGDSSSQVSLRTNGLFETLRSNAEDVLIVSKTDLSARAYARLVEGMVQSWGGEIDSSSLSMIRLCLFNPNFAQENYRQETLLKYTNVISKLITAVE